MYRRFDALQYEAHRATSDIQSRGRGVEREVKVAKTGRGDEGAEAMNMGRRLIGSRDLGVVAAGMRRRAAEYDGHVASR